MIPAPGVYVGSLRHRRFRPRTHAFTYSLFMVLLDIDRLPEAMAVSPFTGYNRWNWASFDERDHLGDPSRTLRERVRASAARSGCELPEGPMFLLTHLRYAGYVFNPISLFYCCDRTGHVRAVLAEVNNTYGGGQTYWLPGAEGDAPVRARRPKSLYVSPFMEYDVAYDFVLTPPGDRLTAHMNVIQPGSEGRPDQHLFDATLRLERRPWTARELHRALVRFPFMTAKVIGAIHWEALRLYLKGLRVQPFPEPATRQRIKEWDDEHSRPMGRADGLAGADRH